MDSPFLLFFAAVTISAWYGGLGPGVVATVLSALGSVLFFFPPMLALQVDEAGGVLRVGLFLIEGMVISGFSGALHHARRQAEDALAARDEFLRIAAHELKNPIAGMYGYAQLMQRRAHATGFSERDRRAIQSIGEQARRLNDLVDRLLDISRIKGGLAVERQPVELTALTRTFVEHLRLTLSTHTLVSTVPETKVWILGDSLRLEQVLHNLLQNAVRYSPVGSEINVALTRNDSQVALAVCDQGIGIPAADIPRIFERYARARRDKAHTRAGLGLGLTIVRALVEAHNGTIVVESCEGHGSTFTIILPLLTPDATDAAVATHELVRS